jgi:hypothetical protein
MTMEVQVLEMLMGGVAMPLPRGLKEQLETAAS